MKTFTIDNDNNITVYASAKAAKEAGTGICFAEGDNLAELLGADSKRLVEIWNTIPGVLPIKKFTSNAVAQKRIMAAISSLTTGVPPTVEAPAGSSDEATPEAPKAKRAPKGKDKPAKAAKTPKAAKTEAPKPAGSGPRATSKTAQLIEMLKRPGGATLEEIMAKFEWQIHTTRALMSAGGALTKKHRLTVISEKVGDSRTYRIAS